MRYKILGKSGMKVSELCLGTMTFGTEWNWGSSKDESRKVFDRFVEAGGNFFDTANFYTKGTSEKMLGEFIASQRERFVIASKYTLSTNPQDPNAGGNHRKNLVQSLDASLKRLKVDYIDLYWIHAWDGITPIDEVMRALDDMVRAGKILHIGASDIPAWVVSRANTLADFKNFSGFVALQLQYSLIERTIENEYFRMARDLDMSILPWSPLGSGMLTGKYKRDSETQGNRLDIDPMWRWILSDKNFDIADEVQKIAREIGHTPAQVALNWVRQKSRNIIPIIGAKNEAQIKENLNCLSFELTGDQMHSLDEISKPAPTFPHNFLSDPQIMQIIHGETLQLVDKS
jgi:aryl-alcohol dehydrogenase-like predicted oxidoreductase